MNFLGDFSGKLQLVASDWTICGCGQQAGGDQQSDITSPPRSSYYQRVFAALPLLRGPAQHSYWDPQVDIFDPPKVFSPLYEQNQGNSFDRRLISRRQGYHETGRRKITFQNYQLEEIRKALLDWIDARPAMIYTMPAVPDILPGTKHRNHNYTIFPCM